MIRIPVKIRADINHMTRSGLVMARRAMAERAGHVFAVGDPVVLEDLFGDEEFSGIVAELLDKWILVDVLDWEPLVGISIRNCSFTGAS